METTPIGMASLRHALSPQGFQEEGSWVCVMPIVPPAEGGWEFFQFPVGIGAADASQTIGFGEMIPQAFGLVVKEHKRPVVSPATGAQRQYLAVNFAAVHGSQLNQGSVSDRHVLFTEFLIHHFHPG